MIWNKSESAIRPDEVDITSSKTSVFLRRNIVEKQQKSAFDGEMQTYYEYEETKLTKEEYKKYLKSLSLIDIQQERADIDYIALYLGVDLYEV